MVAIAVERGLRFGGVRALALGVVVACVGATGGCPAPREPVQRRDARAASTGCAVVPAPQACAAHPGEVQLEGVDTAFVPAWPPERYELDTRAPRARVRAGSGAGVQRAEATLAQLTERGHVPRRVVDDEPAFAWRGLLLDVARHFFPVSDLERVLDRMALLKLNVLHLHLSDDQGFRVELDAHPELARARRRGEGAARVRYSKAELAGLVAYAGARGIDVVPELDLPGHTLAILASHPELSCTGGPFEVPSTWGVFDDVLCVGNPGALRLVGEVLTELASIFPSRYVHIGGDEVPTTRWEACAKCQAAARAAGLHAVSELQGVFTAQISALVRGLGKVPVAWDEVLETSSTFDGVVMVWRTGDAAERALRAGRDVVLVPNTHTYLDAKQVGGADEPGAARVVSWSDAAAFAPTALARTPGARGRALGGQAALWTEHVTSLEEIDARLFPRLFAVAEALWSGARRPAVGDLERRVQGLLPGLEARGVHPFLAPPELPERRVFLETATLAVPESPLYGGRTEVSLGDGPFTPYSAPLSLDATTRVRAVRHVGARSSAVSEGQFVREALAPAVSGPVGGPGVLYEYAEGAFERAPARIGDVLRAGTLPTFGLPQGRRAHDYALRERARFLAPTDGIYTFFVTSDDGAVLYVDGRVVVDNDGRHAPRERAGEAALARGAHDVVVTFFQAGGGDALSVSVQPPGGPKGDLGELSFLPR